MRHQSRVIAFLVASPFEVLDLTGPLSVFTYPTVKGKPYYSFEILSNPRSPRCVSLYPAHSSSPVRACWMEDALPRIGATVISSSAVSGISR